MKLRSGAFGVLAAVVYVATALFAQSGEAPVRFEMADIHLRPRSVNAIPSMTAGMLRGSRYDLRSATMLDLIRAAYGVAKDHVVGGPNWLDWNRFDIVAKAPASASAADVSPMLQALLAERFKLVVHRDTKSVPGYVLTKGTGAPKLKAAAADAPGTCEPLPNQQTATGLLAGIGCHGVTMGSFAPLLRARAGAYIAGDLIDATGLQGAWDFDLRWTPRLVLAQGGTSLPDAIDQQLGLKLEPRDVPASVLVVERVSEKPTPNPSGVSEDLPAPPPAEFDVADIKLSPPDAPSSGRIQAGGRLDFQGMTLKTFIKLAWTLSDDELLAGGPKWLDTTKYSLVARSTTAIAGTTGAMQIDIDDLRLMLRALLIQRFKLATHFEDRPVSAYTLVADKPKLRPADPANRTNCKDGAAPGMKDPRDTSPMLSRLVTCQNMTMQQFTEDLPRIAGGYIHVPVVNATDVDGAWDFTLNFSPVGRLGGAGPAADAGATAAATPMAADPSGGLSLFDALERQLGVKLELRKRPIPVLVIDSVQEQPSSD